MNNLQAPKSKMERALAWLVLGYQVVAAAALIAYVVLAFGFFSQPFMGVFLDSTLINNGIHPDPVPAQWSLVNQGSEFGEQIQSLDSRPISSYKDIAGILESYKPGEVIPAEFKTIDGQVKSYQVTLGLFSTSDRVTYFYIPYIIGLIFLVISWWIFGLRRSDTSGRAFIVFSTTAAITMAGLLDNYTSNLLIYLWSLALPFLAASLMQLALVFPQEPRFFNKYAFMHVIPYVIAFGLGMLNCIFLFDLENPYRYLTAWRITYVAIALSALFFFGMMIYRRFGSKSPVVRQQSGTILIGSIIAFGPVILYFLFTAVSDTPVNFNPLILTLVVVFPIVTGYTVLRSRILRTDYMVARGMLYLILVILATLFYLLVLMGVGMIVGDYVAPHDPIVIGLTIAGLVALSNPVRVFLQQRIDKIFFRGQRAYQESLQAFSHELTNAVALPEVLKVIREQINATLLPERVHVYIYDPTNDRYVASPDASGRLSSDIYFSRSSPLVNKLQNDHVPLYLDMGRFLPGLEQERVRLTLLGSVLYLAMPGKDRLVGWIALGPRMSGEVFTSIDLNYLESICDQAAVAIERAQIILNMERRVQEMNVLSRVSQGVNITLRFDDILELIYAQASQVLPSNDFRLTLYNKTGQYAYYSFYLEDDERISHMENKPLPPKTSLSQEVIMARRSIVTTDYSRECQMMGVTPYAHGIYAWLGVPLNAGSETLGALSVGSRDSSVIYTPRQVEILQAIADQAAGAIVKARLLQETERRAVQLNTLNVLTRQLTSTLELEPLLKNLLDSAANILNCEAGTLFLVDEQTDELVFRVTGGPVASNLVGQRLPAGSGVVGRVVNERAPVIVNEVQASATQWSDRQDQQTGFVTRAILAVPLEVKDRVIGVIELINKKDGLPFTEDDQTLLAAFAGQAAVAVDNARLYTLTDQELNARVEELSVMQRIDRELNASLDIERALNITLEWAMRQSTAQAGLIGILDEKGIRLMAQQGYEGMFEGDGNTHIPLGHPAVAEAIETAQPMREALTAAQGDKAFLMGARSQLVVPIRRESKVIGLLLLESPHPDQFGEQSTGFLARLSDHAAIAIANAQLYNEIQAANSAKSQFVSFVAHELKNPMASIKGYTELVAGGMAGPITEMQAKFLATVRSNVDRMNTIVSDLSDVNKIEAGKLKLVFKTVDIAEVLEETVRSIRRQIEEKEQVVEFITPEKLPYAWADRDRMMQISVNLVSNATKYTPKGGTITIGTEVTQVDTDSAEQAKVIHAWVKDTGIGINPEDRKNIFQQYYRTEYSKEMASGTGLGLNITKSLVEMQGGKIWFESEVGKGTTFHLTIPISES